MTTPSGEQVEVAAGPVDLGDALARQAWDEIRASFEDRADPDIAESLIALPEEQEGIVFRLLPRKRAASVFSYLPLERQEIIIQSLNRGETRDIVHGMTPDDRVRLLDELPAEITRRLLETLDPRDRMVTDELLGFPPETAGRAMTPEYAALSPEWTAGEALDRIRRQPHGVETLNVLFVVDEAGRLVDDLRLATLVRADPSARIRELEDRPLVVVNVHDRLEDLVQVFEKYDRVALPVVDDEGAMLGIITVDDVLDFAREEATEDIHKLGGLGSIDTPYSSTSLPELLRKRGGWLSVLFFGEMLTAVAMSRYADDLERAVVLALFVPLVISSGGNSGSQAASLVIRALALAEVTPGDWPRVLWREAVTGLTLGAWLGLFGFFRIAVWQLAGWSDYGEHWFLLGATLWASLVGVVAFGTLVGSLLPLLLRRIGLDPATSSTPFVATLVDVAGLLIYFTVAAALLRGTIL